MQSETNKGFEQQRKLERERFDGVELGMKASVENITRKYMEVDEKIAMIIDDKLRVYKQLLEIMKVKKKTSIQFNICKT